MKNVKLLVTELDNDLVTEEDKNLVIVSIVNKSDFTGVKQITDLFPSDISYMTKDNFTKILFELIKIYRVNIVSDKVCMKEMDEIGGLVNDLR